MQLEDVGVVDVAGDGDGRLQGLVGGPGTRGEGDGVDLGQKGGDDGRLGRARQRQRRLRLEVVGQAVDGGVDGVAVGSIGAQIPSADTDSADHGQEDDKAATDEDDGRQDPRPARVGLRGAQQARRQQQALGRGAPRRTPGFFVPFLHGEGVQFQFQMGTGGKGRGVEEGQDGGVTEEGKVRGRTGGQGGKRAQSIQIRVQTADK
jgi:hypothetical protein